MSRSDHQLSDKPARTRRGRFYRLMSRSDRQLSDKPARTVKRIQMKVK